MVLRECDECGEMVDDVRAFCPGCGNSFLNETQRSKPTIFDRSNETEQFDASMLNMILSDMGLDISKAPNTGEERVVSVPQMHIGVAGRDRQKSSSLCLKRCGCRKIQVLNLISSAKVI